MATGLFVITVAAFTRIPVVAQIGNDLSLSSVGVGALASAFAVGRVVTDIPAGRLSDRVRPGIMMAIAGSLVMVGSALLAIAQTPPLAFVGVFIAGIGSAWTLTTSMAYFARAPKARRGKSLSYMAGALLTGQAVGPAIGGVLAGIYDWRWSLVLAAALAGLAAVPFLRWHGPERVVIEGDADLGDDRATPLVLAVLYLLPAVQFSIGAAIMQTLIPLLADGPLGIPVGVVGIALGLGAVGRFAGAMMAGQVSDRYGRRPALLPGLAIQVVGLLALMVSESVWAWWATILLVSVGSVTVNVGTTMLADLSGGSLGHRLGVFRLTGDSAFVVAPLLAGWLYAESGQAMATLPSVLLTVFVLLAAFRWLPETHR